MTAQTAFFNRTYDEALALLIEARNYLAHQEAAGIQRGLPADVRLRISYHSMRVTSRLTQVMAWLLAQKAVHAGELSVEEAASERFALAGGRLCADPSGPEDEDLPDGLRSLLERSHSLYARVSRLDDMVRRSVA